MYEKMAKVEAVCEGCFKKGRRFARAVSRKGKPFPSAASVFICAYCVEWHRMLRAFEGHKVESLGLKKGGAAHLPLKETPPPMCPEHDKTMKIFCFECNRVIFRNCLLYDHREHKSNFLNMCATEARKTLHDSLLRRVQANITGARKNLAGTESQVGSEDEDICQTVKRSFRQLRAVLEQRETELLKNCADSGPREERCSDSSEEGASNGPDRNPEPCRVCGAERRGHQ